jgi:NADH-quinone oxidoreductase subunit I
VKVVERPVEQVSYIRATLSGLVHTFKHMVDPHKVTMQYPDEKWALSPAGGARTGCSPPRTARRSASRAGSAPTICPSNCIKLVPARTSRGTATRSCSRSTSSAASSAATARRCARRRRSTSGRHYENAEYSREGFVYDLERLTAQTHPVSELWDPADPKGE